MGNACCPDRGGIFLTDEFCGNFTIPCEDGADPVTVWNSDFEVSGTVSVFYDRGCADPLTVDVLLAGSNVGTLTIPSQPGNTGNTRSITLPAFDELQITCDGTGNACTGKYCLNIHYPAP